MANRASSNSVTAFRMMQGEHLKALVLELFEHVAFWLWRFPYPRAATLAQVSRSDTVRFHTGAPGRLSGSGVK